MLGFALLLGFNRLPEHDLQKSLAVPTVFSKSGDVSP
jgi:hypothetical protein